MLPIDILPGLDALLRGTPGMQIVKDLLVIGHLGALAVGLGTVLRTDMRMLLRLRDRFTGQDFTALTTAHHAIGLSILALWATGLGLFVLKTGGDPAAASPKLVAKLVTVSWLSLTAACMSTFGLPLLARAVGRPLAGLPLVLRLKLAVFAGMSAAGWGTALLLGAAGTTLTAEWGALRELLLMIHGGAVGGMMLAAVLVGRWSGDTGPGLRAVTTGPEQVDEDVALPQAA